MNFFIDPAYKAYYQNRLFQTENKVLNRDGTLLPFVYFKNFLEEQGFTVQTFDFYYKQNGPNIYWSFGILDKVESLALDQNLILDSFFISEPPLVAKHLYDQLPILTRHFKKVFVHNVHGDGYSLQNVQQDKLRKFHWPQPFHDVLEKFWSRTDRQNAVLMINGRHRPRFGFARTELYSQRIQAAVQLNKYIPFDLYGRGWDQLLNRNAIWWTYLKNYFALQKIYKGPVESKFEVMSQYDYALCFENLIMDGYITEKIFDCFYSGTIPIYWGPRDIQNYIPKSCYIEFQQFTSVQDLAKYLKTLSIKEKLNYKENARNFLLSEGGKKYTNSLINEFQNLASSI